MTDQELIARLGDPNRDWPEFGHDRREAKDRIEQLNERLTAATDDAKEAEAYAEELEAKLTKAVAFIRRHIPDSVYEQRQRANAFLAELEVRE